MTDVDAETEEDMLVYVCYIAECVTFKKKIEVATKPLSEIRNRILNTILALLHIGGN